MSMYVRCHLINIDILSGTIGSLSLQHITFQIKSKYMKTTHTETANALHPGGHKNILNEFNIGLSLKKNIHEKQKL